MAAEIIDVHIHRTNHTNTYYYYNGFPRFMPNAAMKAHCLFVMLIFYQQSGCDVIDDACTRQH